MTSKEQVLLELKKRTANNAMEENRIFTAMDLSKALKLSRNTVSQYLNESIHDGFVIKINTRPVYFFDRKVLENKMGVILEESEYDSFESLKQSSKHDFDQLIGYSGSLFSIIEQCKAAMSYPDDGLPIMIYGPTGTGKTLLANTMYDYAIHQGSISSSSRLVSVNCSEYANNPELLTSNLFGYVKGAYTGAEEEQDGLIALANGGVLFLDEVHCLKAECQEKLFQFMDKGVYHKVGDNDKWYTSKCRLIFATTENPSDALLMTLLRRIPITVYVPSLKERPLIEKRKLIYHLFANEEKLIHKEIYISNLVYSTFLDFEFKGNVGEMKNAVKAICAKAFLDNKSSDLQIHLMDLPSYFFDSMQSIQFKTHDRKNETLFSIHELKDEKKLSTPLLQLYSKLLNSFENGSIEDCCHSIESFIDYLYFKQKYSYSTTNEAYLLKIVDKIYSIIMNRYSFVVANSKIHMYSKLFIEYSKNVTDTKIWISSHLDQVNQFSKKIQEMYPRAYSIALEIIDNASLNLDIQLDEMMQIIITLMIVKDDKNDENSGVVGLILCHGYSTASSIADTVNRMLDTHIFDGIDMELQISIEKIGIMVNDYLKKKAPIRELMLLVDMGSLEEIYDSIHSLSQCNIGLVNNVSTFSALQIGTDLVQGKSVKNILEDMQENFQIGYRFIENQTKPDAILTVCATGFGSAKKIGELLKNSLPKPISLDIIPYDYQSLVSYGIRDRIFNEYNVKMIIGTLDPKVNGIDFMPMENIMMNDKVQILHSLMADYLSENELVLFNENIAKNFTLDNIVNHLTILNPNKVMEDVEEIVKKLETIFGCSLDITTKVGLYVHLSCLIERLILRQGIMQTNDMDAFVSENKEAIELVKEVFSVVSERYSVEIPIPEIQYILNYFNLNEA